MSHRIRHLILVALVVAGACEQTESPAPPPPTTQLSAEEAKARAWSAYIDARNLGVLAEEGVDTPSLVRGDDDGAQMWQTRVTTIDGVVRATIRVHPESGEAQVSLTEPCSPEGAGELVDLIGCPWTTLRGSLESTGSTLTDDGPSRFVVRGPGSHGNFLFTVTDGNVDGVEAWAQNGLSPAYSAVVGSVVPGMQLVDIEKHNGPPIYQQIGKHGLRMRGWLVHANLVFVTGQNGTQLDQTADRIFAFRASAPPSWAKSLVGEHADLAELASGKPHIEPLPD